MNGRMDGEGGRPDSHSEYIDPRRTGQRKEKKNRNGDPIRKRKINRTPLHGNMKRTRYDTIRYDARELLDSLEPTPLHSHRLYIIVPRPLQSTAQRLPFHRRHPKPLRWRCTPAHRAPCWSQRPNTRRGQRSRPPIRVNHCCRCCL